LSWCPVSENFPWAVVQAIFNGLQFFGCDRVKVSASWQVLPQQAVRVFDCSALPGAVRIAEVDRNLEFVFDQPVPGELATAIGCQAVDPWQDLTQALDQTQGQGFGLAGPEPDQPNESRPSLHGTQHSCFAASRTQGVDFPMPNVSPLIHMGGTLPNAAGRRESSRRQRMMPISAPMAAMLPQGAALATILGNASIDAGMADCQTVLTQNRHHLLGAVILP